MWEFFAGLGFFIGLLSVLAFAFWLWMLIDCLQNTSLDGTEKIVWILVLIFLPFLGALIYFFIGRSKRI